MYPSNFGLSICTNLSCLKPYQVNQLGSFNLQPVYHLILQGKSTIEYFSFSERRSAYCQHQHEHCQTSLYVMFLYSFKFVLFMSTSILSWMPCLNYYLTRLPHLLTLIRNRFYTCVYAQASVVSLVIQTQRQKRFSPTIIRQNKDLI